MIRGKLVDKNTGLKTDTFWIVLISIFYLVGIVGIALPQTREYLVPLSTFHLLLTFLVLYWSRQGKKDTFLYFSFLVIVVGILVEMIGTKTGLLFGTYHYGTVLGFNVLGVPTIIGFNWATMVVVSSTWAARLKASLWIRSLFAAFLMTGLDVLIEPVAMELGYWSWANDEIPFYNYVCWFAISLPMHYFYMKWNLVEENKVPKAVYILMLVFFVVLNLA